MREFTETEIQEIQEAENGLREAGLDCDHGGADHNAGLILDYFQQNLNLPVTVRTIYALVEMRKNDFIWRTPAQRQYDRVARQTDPAQVAAVNAWLQRQNILVKEGEESFQNSTVLLRELRGRQITHETVLQAIGRIQTKGNGKLHFTRRPTQTTTLLPNHALNAPSEPPKSDGRRYVHGKLNHAFIPTPNAAVNQPTSTKDAWQALTENLANNGTHGQQAQLQAVITQNFSKPWREIYRLVEQAKRTFDNRLIPR